ncbi:MAG: lysylphosphatidylglycerol synthase transmembrane domain-containing protein [Pirellulaceae bacterium]
MNRSDSGIRRWLPAIRAIVVLAVGIGLIVVVYKAWQQLRNEPIALGQLDWLSLVIGVLLYSLTLVVTALYWRSALISLGGQVQPLAAVRAFAFSQLGKYLPGKAMVVVIRADMVRSEQTRLGAAVASVFIETLMWIFVGAQIASAYFLISGNGGSWLKLLALSIMIVSGLVTIPPNFKKLARVVGKLKKSAPITDAPEMTWATFLRGIVVLSIAWMIAGLSAQYVVGSIPGTEVVWSDFWLILATVALATVGGFVSLIPGGIGVRELVIIPLLAPRYSTAVALVAALLIRLVWIMSELLVSGTIELLYRYKNSR